MEKNIVRKAVIPAAGYGTRFLPATKVIAKEMFPIIDTPTIQLIVEEALKSGITEFLIIVSSNKNSIVDYFDRNLELEHILKAKGRDEELKLITDLPNKVNIHFVRQKEQLGLGHAVLQAKAFVGNEPFALLLGDDVYVGNDNVPALKQIINAFYETNSSILGTLFVSKEEVSKFGICDFGDYISDNRLCRLASVDEKPSASDAKSRYAIGGRYVLTPRIFHYLQTQEPGISGEIQLTDSIRRLMSEEEVYSYAIDGRRYDIGTRSGYIEAIIDFALGRETLREDMIKIIKDKYSHL
jgi:UTP--glucose-1-phosphate uridylyltransferase